MRDILALLLALALVSCGPAGGGQEGGGWGKKKNAPAEALPVRTEKLKRGLIALKLLTTSTVDPVRRVDLVSKAGGVVKEIVTPEGAAVKEGDVVAKLDDEELALARRKADVNASKARADYDHASNLLKEKFIAVDEFRKTEQAWKTAELELETATVALANATLHAPIGGTLTRLDIQKGRYVQPNTPLGEITDLTELEAVIFVPERDLMRLKEGQTAEVTSESLASAFPAQVKRVNPVVDRSSGTARAFLALTDPTGRLRPGMFIDVSIVLESRPDALLVPKKAMVYDEGRPGVFVLRDGAAKWCELELGFQEKDIAESAKGAAEGDDVIVVGQNGLKDGTKVKVLAE